jgi:enoyl-CoA hydratase/carnithine racemase
VDPFRVRRVRDVLELTLDTPDACVNVFGPPAAAQLDAVLDAPPRGVSTLLLRSNKPGSFVNGAGLLYANAMRSIEGALSVSEPVREVYERLAASSLTTVAFIEGNCFGCGLELALACDVRIARDTAETLFRMTEVTDYRFVPLFGGTWRLPRRVGGEAAAKLLLDGESWDAKAARSRGLVDHVLGARAREDTLMALVRQGEGRGARKARPTAPSRRDVPPTRAALYAAVEELLASSASASPGTCRRREVMAFARTVTAMPAKQAMSFFFVRHAARAASFGSADRVVPRVRARVGSDAGSAAARAAWRRIVEAETRVLPNREAPLAVVSPREARWEQISVFFPHGLGVPVCEISARREDLARARALGRWLVWLGVETVITLGGGEHLSRVLLDRTRGVLRRLVASGTSASRINQALWDLGSGAPFRPLRGWPRTRRRGAGANDAVEALSSMWEETLREALARRVLVHASQGDVLIHTLFDFPVELGSFSRWRAARGARAAEAAE